jgi:putative transposase
MESGIKCKYCQSEHVIKYGKLNDVQRYFCRDCNRKFVSGDTIPKMHNSTSTIADALNMYYEGMSLNNIRRNLIQQDKNYISKISAYNWVDRFTDLAIKEAKKYHPDVGSIWVADETYVRVDRNPEFVKNPYTKSRKAKWVIFWDIIDAKTRFLLASHITSTRTTKDAQALMEKASRVAGKTPRIVVTDKLRAYLDGVELAFGSDTHHRRSDPFEIGNNNNLIERFHGTLKERTKVMRALKNKDTLKKFADGWLVYYNFFRPHMSLDDKTPAQAAGINFPFHNWKELIENQPYSVTAKIPIKEGKLRISARPPRITQPMPKLR